jgi:hypothetical protein
MFPTTFCSASCTEDDLDFIRTIRLRLRQDKDTTVEKICKEGGAFGGSLLKSMQELQKQVGIEATLEKMAEGLYDTEVIGLDPASSVKLLMFTHGAVFNTEKDLPSSMRKTGHELTLLTQVEPIMNAMYNPDLFADMQVNLIMIQQDVMERKHRLKNEDASSGLRSRYKRELDNANQNFQKFVRLWDAKRFIRKLANWSLSEGSAAFCDRVFMEDPDAINKPALEVVKQARSADFELEGEGEERECLRVLNENLQWSSAILELTKIDFTPQFRKKGKRGLKRMGLASTVGSSTGSSTGSGYGSSVGSSAQSSIGSQSESSASVVESQAEESQIEEEPTADEVQEGDEEKGEGKEDDAVVEEEGEEEGEGEMKSV